MTAHRATGARTPRAPQPTAYSAALGDATARTGTTTRGSAFRNTTRSTTATRRGFLGLGASLAGITALAACTPQDTLDVSAATAGGPVTGGILDYFEPQTWTTLYPPSVGFYPNGGIMNNISDRLLWQDPETLELYPWIAEDLPEINDSATQFTFRIRPGVTYADGSPLDAANVAKNFDLFGRGDTERALPVSEQIANYDRAEVLDDLTVRFHFTAPSLGFQQAVSTMNQGLLADSTLDLDSEGFGPGSATKIITSGPFHITEEAVSTKLSVRVREDYDWAPPHLAHQGRAHLDGIDYRVNQEYSVRVGALVSGQVHGLRDLQAPDEARIEEAGLQVFAKATNGINNGMSFRFRHPFLQDVRVRRAIIRAIDRQEIVDKLFTPNFPLARGIIGSNAWGYVDLAEYFPYDPDEAAALLDEAGWTRPAGSTGIRTNADGERLQLGVNIALPQPRSREVQTLVQQHLARVGIGWTINEGDQSQQTLNSLDIDKVNVYHSMVARADYDNVRSNWHSVNRNAFLNAESDEGTDIGPRDPEIDRLLDHMASRPTDEERNEAAIAFQRYLAENAYVLPFFEEPQVFAFRRAVQGFATEPVGRPAFYDTWLADENSAENSAARNEGA
ncbi:TIGR04028 family ABC transporter substrate-binding protein [Brevibacterium litoralis]|uniref:TIGR04028 family ABC transporter substrate-binding protein n=1 Tax=Brevibacterium litoralis TaxID=3138935 RepID=UPI0032EB9E4F